MTIELCKTDDDIRDLIAATCRAGDMPELAGNISVCFEQMRVDVNSDFALNPPRITINRNNWKTLPDKERAYLIRAECCHIMACTKLGRKVHRCGDEWRFFAIKTNTVEISNKAQAAAKSFVLLPSW